MAKQVKHGNVGINGGIWKYRQYLPHVDPLYQLTLGEGNTPVKEIEGVLFKCEYENPTGSVKDRAVAYQISKLKEKGINMAVISSSGNAAISAASYCQLADINLTVFVSTNINKFKLNKLKKTKANIIQTARPVSEAFQFAKKNSAYSLRQSRDPNATYGYSTIAYELNIQINDIDAIFLPVSSGTTLVGIAFGFTKLNKLIPIHAVQTSAIHPVSSIFDKDFQPTRTSLADAVVAKFTPRQDDVVNIIKKTKGWGWVVADKELKETKLWLLNHGINCSYEGAAALAALWKAKQAGYNYKRPVCILTGRFYG